jgi:hypothetical protein
MGLAQTDLAEDGLASEELGPQTDHEAEHGQTAIPGFSEGDESVTGSGISHEYFGL